MRSAFSATCIFDSINVEDSVSVNTYRESMLHARAAADEAAAAGEPEYEFWSSTPDTHGLSSLLPVILGAMFKASSGDIDPVRKAYTDHIAPFQVKYGAPAIRSNRVGPKALLHHQLELHGCESWRIAQGGGDEPGALFQASGGLSSTTHPSVCSRPRRRRLDLAHRASRDPECVRQCHPCRTGPAAAACLLLPLEGVEYAVPEIPVHPVVYSIRRCLLSIEMHCQVIRGTRKYPIRLVYYRCGGNRQTKRRQSTSLHRPCRAGRTASTAPSGLRP